MIVLVTGGRDFTDRDLVFRALDAIHLETPIGLVVHGACGLDDAEAFDWKRMRGADRCAHEWAAARFVPAKSMPAAWTAFGPAAGPIRNKEMVSFVTAYPERMCVAFPGNRGTADCVAKARRANMRVKEVA